jgi:hypothetical protein
MIKHRTRLMGLNVTNTAFNSELGHFLETIINLPDNEERILNESDVEFLVSNMRRVSDILKFESKSLQAYLIPEKRLPVDKLISDISSLFGESVYTLLPDITQYDFTQAGKCIAFEVPTAAAFHILRGTEGVLREYYSALIETEEEKLMWGPMVRGLRELTDEPPPSELLNNLDNIRVSFRNPTQHPEKIFDLDEAQDVFNLCVDVINRMAKDLLSRGIWEHIMIF